jgi:hypothetical protein
MKRGGKKRDGKDKLEVQGKPSKTIQSGNSSKLTEIVMDELGRLKLFERHPRALKSNTAAREFFPAPHATPPGLGGKADDRRTWSGVRRAAVEWWDGTRTRTRSAQHFLQ